MGHLLFIMFLTAATTALPSSTSAESAGRPITVKGRIIHCFPESAEHPENCSVPKGMPGVILNAKRIGGNKISKIYSDSRARYSTSLAPGQYEITLAPEYEGSPLAEEAFGCLGTGVPFPPGKKILVVGSKLRVKDLYFMDLHCE